MTIAMAKKNHYSNGFKASLTRAQWEQLCPPMEYRVIDGPQAYSLGLVHPSMADVNCVVVGASGSMDDTIMYFANAMRVDDPKIDQEPYFEVFQCGQTAPSLYGNFHHAAFSGSREDLTPADLRLIAARGSNADICFTSKPDNNAGRLEDLRVQGKITGFDYTWDRGMNIFGANSSASGSAPSAGTEKKK